MMLDQRPRAGGDRSTARNWLEDPRISLEGLTPGQRYTAVIVVVLAILMVKVGLPRTSSSLAASQDRVATASPHVSIATTSTTMVGADVATSADPSLVVMTPPPADTPVTAI